ncbi:MAG: hypothetical protein Q9219_000347 [cf. Caloplaca sp. 3 TL-2023]
MEAREVKGERLLRIRNPWGDTEWQGPWSDGSEQWTPEWMQLLNHRFGDDGMFWISYKDFLRKYQSLDRTRLFGPEWQITQQWTTVDVPWSADYNDTKYNITVTKPGPVVIVLSQLDSRYFKGLEGQYTFQLNFRLEKDGDESFVVRSHSNYSMSRSVSTDMELKPGTYSVLMKITAKRWTGDLTPDQVVRNSCMERPEKLIQVGLSYDLAHAKGQIKETEREKAAREARAQKKKAEEHQKRRAELRAQMLTNWETGKKRLARTKRHARRKEDYFKKKADAAKLAGGAEAAQSEIAKGDGDSLAKAADVADPDAEMAANQSPQAGSEAENIDISETKPVVPPSPPPDPPEAAPGEDDEAAWEDEEQPKATCDREDSKKATDDATVNTKVQEGAGEADEAPMDEAKQSIAKDETENEDNDDWEIASDASFTSSIVTALDLPPLSDEAPDAASAEDDGPDEANVGFEDDPWNAVCVVGLKVYSKDKGLCVEIIRPKHELEEEDTPLDVDDAAKGQSVERTDDTIPEVNEES